MKKRYISSIAILIFLCLLVLFPKESLDGATSGLLLWFHTVLPTLLPFLIVSNLIVQLDITNSICSFFYPVLKHFLPITKQGCYPIIIGALSGYPIGAKACGDLVKCGKISKIEGQFLLSLCNNASPMFLISYVTLQSLKCPKYTNIIFIFILLGSLISSLTYYWIVILIRKRKKKKNPLSAASIPNATQETDDTNLSIRSISVSELMDCSILKSFEVITKIGGYIILFSILAQMISSFTFLPKTISYCLIGSLEITTGIQAICTSSFSPIKKIVLTLAITSFGGFSSLAQTKSVINGSELSIKTYFAVKLGNAIFVGILSFLFFTYASFL